MWHIVLGKKKVFEASAWVFPCDWRGTFLAGTVDEGAACNPSWVWAGVYRPRYWKVVCKLGGFRVTFHLAQPSEKLQVARCFKINEPGKTKKCNKAFGFRIETDPETDLFWTLPQIGSMGHNGANPSSHIKPIKSLPRARNEVKACGRKTIDWFQSDASFYWTSD